MSLPGEKHSARHVASMSKAMSVMGDVIARTKEDYEELVVRLLQVHYDHPFRYSTVPHGTTK